MDCPILALLDEGACYHKRAALLHPEGLTCPRFGVRDGTGAHRRHRAPVLDYQCAALLLAPRGACPGVPTAHLARELGCDRTDFAP
jgi:hypothetical protein